MGTPSMVLELDLPREVPIGEAVPIILRLRNDGPATDLVTQGRPTAYDLVITRGDGAVVWRRLLGAMIPAILQSRSLAPGEIVEWREAWAQVGNGGEAVEPGDYLVTGVLPTDPPAQLRTAPRPLRLTPRRPRR